MTSADWRLTLASQQPPLLMTSTMMIKMTTYNGDDDDDNGNDDHDHDHDHDGHKDNDHDRDSNDDHDHDGNDDISDDHHVHDGFLMLITSQIMIMRQ